MPRLASLASSIATLPPRIGYQPGVPAQRDRYRADTQPWRQWYRTHRWQKLRWSVLVRDCFTCNRCKRVIARKGEAICDHVEPHHGDHLKFWAGPFQTLCAHCHNSHKQQQERTCR